ncbi:hypothetical protein [Emticicia sp. 17c]|uniref:hypothetical protein n=1 Tax=Emticicia sp. 17c TaxID=3127704 RepID=UPI00301CE17A
MAEDKFRGAKYNSKLSSSEIAKLVKSEIQKKYPYMIVSVISKTFSGGSSVDVEIKDIGFNPYTKEFQKHINSGGGWDDWRSNHFSKRNDYLTADAQAVKSECESILQSYNRDNSDAQVDYFDVNFYGHTNFDNDSHFVLYLPDSEAAREIEERKQRYKTHEEKRKVSKAVQVKNIVFKYGDVVLFKVNWRGGKETEELGIIMKAPNGEARFGNTYDIYSLKEITDKEKEKQLLESEKADNERYFKGKRNKPIYVVYVDGKPYQKERYFDNRFQGTIQHFNGRWSHWFKTETEAKNKPKTSKSEKVSAAKTPVSDIVKEPKQLPVSSKTVEVALNEKQNGIEVKFDGIPSQEDRTFLKENGFKWGSFNKLWYAAFSQSRYEKITKRFVETPNKMLMAKAKLKLLSLKF